MRMAGTNQRLAKNWVRLKSPPADSNPENTSPKSYIDAPMLLEKPSPVVPVSGFSMNDRDIPQPNQLYSSI